MTCNPETENGARQHIVDCFLQVKQVLNNSSNRRIPRPSVTLVFGFSSSSLFFFFFLLALIFVIGLINHIAGFNKQEDRSATIRRKSCKRFHHILWGWNKTLELFFLPLSHLNEYYSITATSVTSLFAHQNKGKVFWLFFYLGHGKEEEGSNPCLLY